MLISCDKCCHKSMASPCRYLSSFLFRFFSPGDCHSPPGECMQIQQQAQWASCLLNSFLGLLPVVDWFMA